MKFPFPRAVKTQIPIAARSKEHVRQKAMTNNGGTTLPESGRAGDLALRSHRTQTRKKMIVPTELDVRNDTVVSNHKYENRFEN